MATAKSNNGPVETIIDPNPLTPLPFLWLLRDRLPINIGQIRNGIGAHKIFKPCNRKRQGIELTVRVRPRGLALMLVTPAGH